LEYKIGVVLIVVAQADVELDLRFKRLQWDETKTETNQQKQHQQQQLPPQKTTTTTTTTTTTFKKKKPNNQTTTTAPSCRDLREDAKVLGHIEERYGLLDAVHVALALAMCVLDGFAIREEFVQHGN
jgi:hypothetical protein